MPQVGPLEIIVILAVALMAFGPNEMPKVARQAATAWRQVQRFRADVGSKFENALAEVDDAPASTPARAEPPPQRVDRDPPRRVNSD
ncbi:MAG: twin-arginine translocase TatA/TatE family subunit [Actinobacteria bacterium]|nr:twin-arginine translocase TatA/TatE family subunit [Actinomycetota bacterium]